MTIELDPLAVRRAWLNGAAEGSIGLGAADRCLPGAEGVNMAGLTGCLVDAADALRNVAVTGRALIYELGEQMEDCLDVWEATDHQTVGQLHALEDALS